MAEITVYGLKNCDTCRKAVKTLAAAGRDAALVDVRAEPVGTDALAQWYARLGEKLVNTRSTTWKGLDADARAKAEAAEGAVDLLAEHPSLMKRPVVAVGGALYLGWGTDVQTAVLSGG